MKKLLLFAASFAALAACSKEADEEVTTPGNLYVIKASVSASDTKVTTDDPTAETVKFKWEEGDKVVISNGTEQKVYTLVSGTITNEGTQAEFAGEELSSMNDYEAFYLGAGTSLDTYNAYEAGTAIPYSYVAGTFKPFAYGKGSGKSFDISEFLPIFHLQLTGGATLSKIGFETEGAEKTNVSFGTSGLALTNTATDVYFPVSQRPNGFTLKFYDINGIIVRLQASMKNFSGSYNQIISFPELDVPSDDHFCITALEDDTKIIFDSGTQPVTLELSYNANDWEAYTCGTNDPVIDAGEKVYFRAGSDGNNNMGGKSFQAVDSNDAEKTKQVNLSGNIMYLLNGTTPPTDFTESNYRAFYSLFAGFQIKDASGLMLPAKTATNGCYAGMFLAASLEKAPLIQITKLAEGCFSYMFAFCNLTEAQNLPCTEVEKSCYCCMYVMNSNLVSVPSTLPALTMKESCYEQMFAQCSSLEEFPDLPATKLAISCYEEMFGGCKLTSAPELNAEIMVTDTACYSGMFRSCKNLTEAPQLNSTVLAESCYSSMFRNTGLTTAPDLPATVMKKECYANMFELCENLKAAPKLESTQLADACYKGMFSCCQSLTETPELKATELADRCYKDMFSYCSKLVKTTSLPAMTMKEECYFSMFAQDTSITSFDALPATKLASGCYADMFCGCTKLTSAPELAADSLVLGCYGTMFYNCTNLTSVTMKAVNAHEFDGYEATLNPLYEWIHKDTGGEPGILTVANETVKDWFTTGNGQNYQFGWTVKVYGE